MLKITITPEELQALDDANDGVTAVVRSTDKQGSKASQWVCVFRAPKRSEWKRYVQTRDKDQFTAIENLFRSTCVYPAKDVLDELLDAPGCAGIPYACLEAISTLTGVEASTETAK